MNLDGTKSESHTIHRTVLSSSGSHADETGPTGESGPAPFAAAPQSIFGRLLDRLLANAVRAVVLILVIALAIVALPIALALVCACVIIVLISVVRARLRAGRSPNAWSTTAHSEVVDAEWTVQESGSAPEASPGEPRTVADAQDEAHGRRNVRVRR